LALGGEELLQFLVKLVPLRGCLALLLSDLVLSFFFHELPALPVVFELQLALFHIVSLGPHAVTAVDHVFGSPEILLAGDPPILYREPGARV
jgi:hypothetical protein